MSTPTLAPAGARVPDLCAPLSREPITAAQAETVSRMLKALADPVRLQLMSMVLSQEGGQACPMCDLTERFELAVSTLSHHLKTLHDAGLIERDKKGVWVYYRARPEAMDALRTIFGSDLSALTQGG